MSNQKPIVNQNNDCINGMFITEPETNRKREKLGNYLSIRLMKESKKSAFDSVESISNGKNVKIKPIDLTLSNTKIIYYDEVAFEILTPYLLS